MDVNTVRTIVLVLAFVSFVGIVLWAYSSRRKTAFDEAARLPLTESELGAAPRAHTGEND